MKDRKSSGPRPPGDGNKKPRLTPEIQGKIGQQLRKMFDDVVSQGVPDRFAELLNRLDKSKDSERR